jgi:hypothetical protein
MKAKIMKRFGVTGNISPDLINDFIALKEETFVENGNLNLIKSGFKVKINQADDLGFILKGISKKNDGYIDGIESKREDNYYGKWYREGWFSQKSLGEGDFSFSYTNDIFYERNNLPYTDSKSTGLYIDEFWSGYNTRLDSSKYVIGGFINSNTFASASDSETRPFPYKNFNEIFDHSGVQIGDMGANIAYTNINLEEYNITGQIIGYETGQRIGYNKIFFLSGLNKDNINNYDYRILLIADKNQFNKRKNITSSAKIFGQIDETPSQPRYNVFFYTGNLNVKYTPILNYNPNTLGWGSLYAKNITGSLADINAGFNINVSGNYPQFFNRHFYIYNTGAINHTVYIGYDTGIFEIDDAFGLELSVQNWTAEQSGLFSGKFIKYYSLGKGAAIELPTKIYTDVITPIGNQSSRTRDDYIYIYRDKAAKQEFINKIIIPSGETTSTGIYQRSSNNFTTFYGPNGNYIIYRNARNKWYVFDSQLEGDTYASNNLLNWSGDSETLEIQNSLTTSQPSYTGSGIGIEENSIPVSIKVNYNNSNIFSDDYFHDYSINNNYSAYTKLNQGVSFNSTGIKNKNNKFFGLTLYATGGNLESEPIKNDLTRKINRVGEYSSTGVFKNIKTIYPLKAAEIYYYFNTDVNWIRNTNAEFQTFRWISGYSGFFTGSNFNPTLGAVQQDVRFFIDTYNLLPNKENISGSNFTVTYGTGIRFNNSTGILNLMRGKRYRFLQTNLTNTYPFTINADQTRVFEPEYNKTVLNNYRLTEFNPNSNTSEKVYWTAGTGISGYFNIFGNTEKIATTTTGVNLTGTLKQYNFINYNFNASRIPLINKNKITGYLAFAEPPTYTTDNIDYKLMENLKLEKDKSYVFTNKFNKNDEPISGLGLAFWTGEIIYNESNLYYFNDYQKYYYTTGDTRIDFTVFNIIDTLPQNISLYIGITGGRNIIGFPISIISENSYTESTGKYTNITSPVFSGNLNIFTSNANNKFLIPFVFSGMSGIDNINF